MWNNACRRCELHRVCKVYTDSQRPSSSNPDLYVFCRRIAVNAEFFSFWCRTVIAPIAFVTRQRAKKSVVGLIQNDPLPKNLSRNGCYGLLSSVSSPGGLKDYESLRHSFKLANFS